MYLTLAHVAANILYRQNRTLSSRKVESNLRLVASQLATSCGQSAVLPAPGRPKRKSASMF